MEAAIRTTPHLRGESLIQHKAVVSGMITGQIAGLIMATVMMIVFTVFMGTNPLYPVQVIGSAIFGESALFGINLGAILAGVLIHQLGPSLFWGFMFGLIAKRFSIATPATALAYGIGLGALAMMGPYVLVPMLMYALHSVDIWNREVPILWDWAAHLIFGASFVLYPMIHRKVLERGEGQKI